MAASRAESAVRGLLLSAVAVGVLGWTAAWLLSFPCNLVVGTLTGLIAAFLAVRAIGVVQKNRFDEVEADVRIRAAEEENRALKQKLEEASKAAAARPPEAVVLQRKMEAVGRLAGGVAHDFNNLLCAIRGFAELAYDQLDEAHPAKDCVTEIRKAADRAAGLTQQLLAFGRKQVLQPRVVNLADTVRALEAELRGALGPDHRLELSLGDGAGSVRIDPAQFRLVILALAANARDAMEPGGTLRISAESRSMNPSATATDSFEGLSDACALVLQDTGRGMDAETLSHLFEPFYTTKPKGKGKGLGLATAYGTIRQSGGVIEVRSAPGKGTTVTLLLPRAEDRSHTTQIVPKIRLTASPKESVLVVDDEPAIRALGRSVLSSAGYAVDEAADGQAAVECVREHRGEYDLVLTDIVMPRLGGRELADLLRKEFPRVRVLLMSGFTDDAAVHQSVGDRELPFMPKPFTSEVLLEKVRYALDRKNVGDGDVSVGAPR